MTTIATDRIGPTGGSAVPKRLAALPPYPLQDIPEIKARLAAEGREVIDLGVGDSGLPVPDEAVRGLRAAAGDPRLQGYGFQRGLPEYREAIASWVKSRFGASIDPEREVLPVIGSKEAIALMAFACVDPGDTVLVPDPGYAPYAGGSYFAGATIVRERLRPETGFLVPPDRILDVPGNLRLVYLNYPNNPTTAVADRAYLAEVVERCRQRGAALVYDNAYSEITFDGYVAPGLLEVDGGRDTGLEFHSFSKTFNMTGWRLGWACGSERLVSALKRVKTFFDTGSYLGVQAAGAGLLRDPRPWIRDNVDRLRERRDAAVVSFREAGFEVEVPRATLYLWLRVPTAESSEGFCRRLLESSAVVLMPGSAMGAGGEGYARASLSVPPDVYPEVCRRIGAVL